MPAAKRKIRAPITLVAGTLKNPETVPPGEEITLSKEEADAIEARHGKYQGPAPQPVPAEPAIDAVAIKQEAQAEAIAATLKELADNGLIGLDENGNPVAANPDGGDGNANPSTT